MKKHFVVGLYIEGKPEYAWFDVILPREPSASELLVLRLQNLGKRLALLWITEHAVAYKTIEKDARRWPINLESQDHMIINFERWL